MFHSGGCHCTVETAVHLQHKLRQQAGSARPRALLAAAVASLSACGGGTGGRRRDHSHHLAAVRLRRQRPRSITPQRKPTARRWSAAVCRPPTAGVRPAHEEDRSVSATGRYVEGSTEKRAAVVTGPEFSTVLRNDLVSAEREAGDAGFDVLIACASKPVTALTSPENGASR